MKRDQKVICYLDAKTYKAVHKLAEKDGRSMSSYVERIICAHVEASK